MIILISIIIFIICSLILSFLFSILYRNQIRILDRLKKYKVKRSHKNELDELSIPFHTRVVKPIMDKSLDFVTIVTPKGMKNRMEQKLIKAGRPYNLDSDKWFMMIIVFGIITPISLIIFFVFKRIETRFIFFIIMIALFINIMPELLLKSKIEKRKREIITTIPDVLDLLTVSVEAGLSFDGALSRLIEKMQGVLPHEFNRVLNEMRMGKSRKEALKDMSIRCDVSDLTTLIGSLIQADELGVSVSNVIRIQSIQMREKRRQRAQEKAMKAPVKMLFPLIIFIFPSIFVILLGPAIIRMVKTFGN